MKIKDVLIKKTKLDNRNHNLKSYDEKFITEDYIYIESIEDLSRLNESEYLAQLTDYSIALGAVRYYAELPNLANHWLRSPISEYATISVDTYAPDDSIRSTSIQNILTVCPALEFSLPTSTKGCFGEVSGFRFKVDREKRTIMFENLQYPQTIVDHKLHIELEKQFKDGTLPMCGYAIGHEYDSFGNSFEYVQKYYYEGAYYVRISAVPSNEDGSCYSNGSECLRYTYEWFKFEPIVWKIRNCKDLPTSINPNGNGTATSIKVRSEKAIIPNVAYHPNMHENYAYLWQNSTIRGLLNGINVCDIKENGNPHYSAKKGGDFEGRGLIDLIYTPSKEFDEIIEDTDEIKAKEQVDDVFFKAIKDAGLEHLL